MHPLELGAGGVAWRERTDRVVDAGRTHALGHRGEACHSLGVAPAGVVVGEARVFRDEELGHGPTVPALSRRRGRRVRSSVVAERIKGDRARHHSFGWARVVPWRGRRDVAHLVLAEGAPPERASVDDALVRLRRVGYTAVVTSALTAADSLPFVDAGFEVRERLHLLEHDLDGIERPGPAAPVLRRAWKTDRPRVLGLDGLAFDDFWRLDVDSLRDALHATPSVRFRVGDGSGGAIAAYAITGRAGRRGYLPAGGRAPRRASQRAGVARS